MKAGEAINPLGIISTLSKCACVHVNVCEERSIEIAFFPSAWYKTCDVVGATLWFVYASLCCGVPHFAVVSTESLVTEQDIRGNDAV